MAKELTIKHRKSIEKLLKLKDQIQNIFYELNEDDFSCELHLYLPGSSEFFANDTLEIKRTSLIDLVEKYKADYE